MACIFLILEWIGWINNFCYSSKNIPSPCSFLFCIATPTFHARRNIPSTIITGFSFRNITTSFPFLRRMKYLSSFMISVVFQVYTMSLQPRGFHTVTNSRSRSESSACRINDFSLSRASSDGKIFGIFRCL